MKKTLVSFLITALLMIGAVPANGQGITAMLERIDTLESRMDDMGVSLQKIKGSDQVTATQDFSAYDQSLTDFGAQLVALKQEVAAIPAPVNTSDPDPELENRIAQLEQKSQELVPLLQELQASQQAGFTALKASLAAPAVAVTVASVPTESIPVAVEVASGDLVLSGFVDASYFHDGGSGHGSFGLDQVEIDGEKTFGAAGSMRFDVEFVSDGEGGFTPEVEQGYVTYNPEFAGAGSFTFGKFNAPIGFELLDAPDMFQYSHALVFNNGLPTNLTGVMYGLPFNDSWDLAAYVCNGWDVNVDPDKDKTIGGRLGFAAANWGGGLSAIHGTETIEGSETVIDGTATPPDTSEVYFDQSTKLTVFDVDLYFDPTDSWTLGGELNFGDHDLGETSANWWGFLVMSHWDFNPTVGTTVRFDYFDDQDGSRLGNAAGEVRKAFALAPTFVLGDGMGALMEARWEFSDEDVFTNSNDDPSKSAWTFAFEMTYTF